MTILKTSAEVNTESQILRKEEVHVSTECITVVTRT